MKSIIFFSILFIIFIGILLIILYKIILKYKIITLFSTFSTPGTSSDVSENDNTLITNSNCIGNWGPCSLECANDTRTFKVTTPSVNEGLSCETNDEATQDCNSQACKNCIVSDWTECNGTNRTRTRIRTQAFNSKACTPDENNLPVIQTCNNCIVSDWTDWTECNGTNRTRTIKESINGNACTPDENNLPVSQTCNNCIVSDWTECNGTNRTRTRTQAFNSTACTPDENNLPVLQDCTYCYEDCDYGYRKSTNTLVGTIDNLMQYLDVELRGNRIDKCYKDCTLGYLNNRYTPLCEKTELGKLLFPTGTFYYSTDYYLPKHFISYKATC